MAKKVILRDNNENLVYTVDFATQKTLNVLRLAYGWSKSGLFR